ncbi:tail fiber domain-containing protein [bacterium]|nr:tail fiber domain-containing protein [bacterium]
MSKYDFWITLCVLTICIPGYTQTMSVKDSDSHVLMEVNDEGTMGSITLPDTNAALSSEAHKLYNLNGTLIWNGTALGAAGSAGGWTDDGTVVRLTTGTDKVGIGLTSPSFTLDVSGKIGIDHYQVLYLPDQTNFDGTLIIGTGGGALSHSSGDEGRRNTAAGIGVLHANTTGANNTAAGYRSLYNNTTGYTNSAVGMYALYQNTTGALNTGCGCNALLSCTMGNYNTAVGTSADSYNQYGSYNTIVGALAGTAGSYHSKSGNVFIGYQAGYNETGSNKLYIENSNSSTPLIGGDFSADEILLNGKVKSYGTQIIYLPDQTDFRGTLYYGNGGLNLSHGSSPEGEDNIAVGIGTLNANTTGSANTAAGASALFTNTIGYRNTASGAYACYYNTDGNGNTASGYYAILANTTGNHNTGIGTEANRYNQTGSDNTVIGYQAGRGTSNHSKSGNVFLGYQAGYNETGDNKLYIENSNSSTPLIGGDFSAEEIYLNGTVSTYGTQVLYLPDQTDFLGTIIIGDGGTSLTHSSTFDGYGNTAVGIGALHDNTTGNYNTAVGEYACYNNEGGGTNIAVGRMALYNNSSGHGNTAIGDEALYSNQTGYQNTAVGYGTDMGDNLHNSTAIGNGAFVNVSDKVVIGNSSVTTIGGYADWSNYSDRRYKENIEYRDDLGLEFIMKLKTVSFNYTEDENKRRRDGLIAQDVETALDELGTAFSGLIADKDDQRTLNLAYDTFVIPLINAVKEQQAQIESLQHEIEKLQR